MGGTITSLSHLLTGKIFLYCDFKEGCRISGEIEKFLCVSGRLQIYPERNNALIVKVLVIKNKEK